MSIEQRITAILGEKRKLKTGLECAKLQAIIWEKKGKNVELGEGNLKKERGRWKERKPRKHGYFFVRLVSLYHQFASATGVRAHAL